MTNRAIVKFSSIMFPYGFCWQFCEYVSDGAWPIINVFTKTKVQQICRYNSGDISYTLGKNVSVWHPSVPLIMSWLFRCCESQNSYFAANGKVKYGSPRAGSMTRFVWHVMYNANALLVAIVDLFLWILNLPHCALMETTNESIYACCHVAN